MPPIPRTTTASSFRYGSGCYPRTVAMLLWRRADARHPAKPSSHPATEFYECICKRINRRVAFRRLAGSELGAGDLDGGRADVKGESMPARKRRLQRNCSYPRKRIEHPPTDRDECIDQQMRDGRF